MNIQIWIMGEPGLTDAGGAPIKLVSRRSWALLTYLIHADQRPVTRIDLADLLWPDSGSEQARASLRQELAVLRKALRSAGLDVVEAGKETVRFLGPATLVDAAMLQEAIAAGTSEDLRRVADLYRGPLLEGLTLRSEPFADWLAVERARLAALATGAFASLLQVEEDATAARAWLAMDLTAEAAHRTLMRVFAQAGQQTEALQQYETCKAALQRASRSPSPETLELAEEIRTARSAPPKAAQSASDPVSAAAAPQAERGIATILVAQLPQVATLDPGFEPAAVSRAQGRFIDFARRVAEDAGGWLLPGPGDRAVAVFPEDTETAAAFAALMLAEEPVPMDQARPVSPACGLARGIVIVSEGGGLAGVPLQAAARAAAMARAGEVLATRPLEPFLAEDCAIAGGPSRDLIALRADAPAAPPPPKPERADALFETWRAWGSALARADLRTAMAQGEDARALPGDGRAVGDVMVGAARLVRGQIGLARDILTPVEDLYSSSEPFGLDPGLTARALLSWLRCLSGAMGPGGESLRRVLSEARGLRHPPTTLMCLLVAAIVQDELGETRAAFRSANAAYQAADSEPQWQALALACVGRCRDRIGEPAGADQMNEALNRYRGAGGMVAVPMIHGWMAASRLETGAGSEGLALIDEALAEGASLGVLLPEPELLRLQAVLLARQGRAGLDQIETAFVTAIEAARRAGTGLYELRASVSFAAYLRGLGRLRDAVSRLDRGIAAISPGGQSAADMKSAHALRNRLALG